MGREALIDEVLAPKLSLAEWLDLSEDEPGDALGASAGILESVPGCEGLAVDLDALWAMVDRLTAQTEGGG